MKITIEVDEKTQKFLTSFCTLRPTKTAIELLVQYAAGEAIEEEDMEVINLCVENLEEMGPIVENLRQQMVNEIHRANRAEKELPVEWVTNDASIDQFRRDHPSPQWREVPVVRVTREMREEEERLLRIEEARLAERHQFLKNRSRS